MHRPRALSFVLAALGFGSIPGCRAATEWRIVVHSDVPCDTSPRVVVWTGKDKPSAHASAPRAVSATCDSRTDDLYIVPSSADSFVLALTTRVDGGDPALCHSDDPPPGCVLQDWKLTFREHVGQVFETTLSRSCADVKCAEGFTCVRPGICVPDAVGSECEGGCSEQVLAGVPAQPTDVYAAGWSTCIRDTKARLTCWGDGTNGVPGHGSAEHVGATAGSTPASAGPIDFGGRRVQRFALAIEHACAILDDSSLVCWGANDLGQLGYGDTTPRGTSAATMPGKLPTIDLGPGRTAREVAVGEKTTCVILDDRSVKCWGGNAPAQLGYGDGLRKGGTPATVPAVIGTVPIGGPVRQISISTGHVCAVRMDGVLLCWGQNMFGALGLGDGTNRGDTPATVPSSLPNIVLSGGRTARRVFAASSATCVHATDKAVQCWGIGGFGLMGQGDTGTLGDSPATVPASGAPLSFGAGKTVEGLALTDFHACAVFSEGSLRCWGMNSEGQLGYGDKVNRGDAPATIPSLLPPVAVPAGRTVRSVATGGSHTCVILDDATVRCWGLNQRGQLGYGDSAPRADAAGTTPDRLPPVSVPQ